MIVIEDISYSIDDIVDQINNEFGFSFIKEGEDDSQGTILLANGVKLYIKFNESERKLDSAEIGFPSMRIDISDSQSAAELYSESIESAIQIVDLIKRMLGSEKNEKNNN